MNSKAKRVVSITALFLVFCTSQIYVSAGFMAPEATSAGVQQGQDSVGILTTLGNKAVSVNGAESITGTTIISGANLETPAGIGATVSLGNLGSVEIEQDSKLVLTFHPGSIKVLLLRGCVTVKAHKGVLGEIETAKDAVSKTDPKAEGLLRVCHPGSVRVAAAEAAGGLGTLATAAILAAPAAVIIPVVSPGSNPSNSLPQ